MKWFPWFKQHTPPVESKRSVLVVKNATGKQVGEFDSLNDPRFLEFIRTGVATGVSDALANLALLRCLLLISESIAMLPLNVLENGDEKSLAKKHPLYRVLKKRPNDWQTAYEFKRQMQLNVLRKGNAYAVVVRSGKRIIGLVPIDPDTVEIKQNHDFTLSYHVRRKGGGLVIYQQHEILHLRDLSFDGIHGTSRVALAKRALGIASQAEDAISRFFTDGVMAKGALVTDSVLNEEAFESLKKSVNEGYAGPEGSGKFMLLEQGVKPVLFGNSAADAQHLENRNHQIEEIARAFGVPRPLLMMDDTSWGSGIEQLGIYFVQYTLQPWFTCWEQAIERSLLSLEESDDYYVKFNERALLRGTLNDQANFFAKALGSGGHGAWYTANEVRELQDMPRMESDTADQLQAPNYKKGNKDESIKTA